MKRRLLKLGLFLLLGATINVAVAWAVFLIWNRSFESWHTQISFESVGADYESSQARQMWLIDARGWPMRSMFSRSSAPLPVSLTTFVPATSAPTSVVRALPLLPLWPGFAINTIFYAAFAWLLFAFPFALRRRRRIKRGVCPACAYPIGSSPTCTECGKAVPTRT